MIKNTLVALAVSLVVLFTGLALFTPEPIVIQDGQRVGASPGPDVYVRQIFHAGYQYGSDVFATSTTESTFTITNTEFGKDIGYLEVNVGLDTTWTTMASSSPIFDAILGHTAGDTRVYVVYSATTTTATTLTWAGGTGVDLQEDEGETVIQNGLEYARITFIRKLNTDIAMIVELFQVGD